MGTGMTSPPTTSSRRRFHITAMIFARAIRKNSSPPASATNHRAFSMVQNTEL